MTPEEAVLLALAEERGSLRLLLRPALREGPRGRLEITAAAFQTGSDELASFQLKTQVRLNVYVGEVDAAGRGSLVGDVGTGVVFSEVPREALERFKTLVAAGRASLVAHADLITMNRAPATYELMGEIPYSIKTPASEMTSWQKYGLSVAMVPTAYDKPYLDLEIRPEMRILDLLASSAEAVEGNPVQAEGSTLPFVRLKASEGLVRIDQGEMVIVTGLLRAADLEKRPLDVAVHALPSGYLSDNFAAGRELVLLITADIDHR